MNEINAEIWGRRFELLVTYDCYRGENVTNTQIQAINLFTEKITELTSSAKDKVQDFCASRCDETIDPHENIFRFLLPRTIYVKRSSNNERVVALLCDFRYDPEYMIAIVFRNEKLYEVTTDSAIM